MKTLRFSLVALAATALFTACSNDEAVQLINGEEQAISFRVQGGTPELTTRTTATTANNVDAFVVFGIDGLASSNIFKGVTVARQVDGSFDYNPRKYYSIGAADANFFAYSPASAVLNITPTSLDTASLSTSAGFKYEVTRPDATGLTGQVDLLVAATSIADVPIVTGTVDFVFKHALSRIFVKATNSLTENVVITGLSLLNLKSVGLLTGTPVTAIAPPGAPWVTWTWSVQTAPVTPIPPYEYVLANSGVAVKPNLSTATLVTSMEQGMMVLPQATVNTTPNNHASGDFALEVTYDIANLIGNKTYIYLTDGYAFEAGIQYAITIAFGGTGSPIEIDFTIDVSPFTNDSTMP